MRRPALALLFGWIAAFYLVPILLAVVLSFLTARTHGGVEWVLTTKGYASIKPMIIWRTAVFAAGTAVVCTFLSLAISIEAMLHPSPAKRNLIVGLSVFSLVTNSLVKIYSWLLLLGASGPLEFLQWSMLEEVDFRVLLGLVYMYLPFALLMLFEGVQSIDPGLIRAARDLGAGDRSIALRVLVPLSRPFALGAAFVVAVFVFAEFLVPQILGRGKVLLTGNRMAELFINQSNWPAAMALGTIVTALLFVVLAGWALRRSVP